jgi:Domain of unknown function (DUF4062)
MATQRKVLRVFLASPSDLTDERAQARAVIDGINRTLREALSWQIELFVWEDLTPRFGRPQDAINADVDHCDLFVGALWRRWGQPTGGYSSGFDEEFRRALARRRSTGSPEIAIYFKAAEASLQADPGAQYRSVLAFRREIEDGNELFFDTFDSVPEWSLKLYELLLSHALRTALTGNPTQPQSPSIQGGEPHSPVPGPTAVATQSPASAMVNVLRTLASSLEEQPADLPAVPSDQVDRLYLLAQTLLAQSVGDLVLGPHQVNRLYLKRDLVHPLAAEAAQLERVLVSEASDVSPAWYWFRDDADWRILAFVHRALFDPDAAVREKSIRLLALCRVAPSNRIARHWELGPTALRDGANRVVTAALSWIGEFGKLDALPWLDGALPPTEAREARLRILARHRPSAALDIVAGDGGGMPPSIATELMRRSGKLSKVRLRNCLAGEDATTREFAANALASSGSLSVEMIERLFADPAGNVRATVAMCLPPDAQEDLVLRAIAAVRPVNLPGLSLDRQTSTLVALFARLPLDLLRKRASWQQDEAYRALCLTHFSGRLADEFRADLRTGFTAMHARWEAEIKTELGDRADDFLRQDRMADINDYLRRLHTISVLTALAQHGRPADAAIARKFAQSEDREIQLSALRVLLRFGHVGDVPTVLKIAERLYIPQRTEVAVEIAKFVFATNARRSAQRARNGLIELMYNSSDDLRLAAVRVAIREFSRADLERLIDEYPTKRRSYYYNVMVWLDRALHAPSPIRDAYLSLN